MKDSPQLATAGVVIGPPGVVAGDPKGQPLSNPNTLGDAGTATWRGCDSQLQRRRPDMVSRTCAACVRRRDGFPWPFGALPYSRRLQIE